MSRRTTEKVEARQKNEKEVKLADCGTNIQNFSFSSSVDISSQKLEIHPFKEKCRKSTSDIPSIPQDVKSNSDDDYSERKQRSIRQNGRLYGALPNNGAIEEFASIILNYGLMDAGYEGIQYTWANSSIDFFNNLMQPETSDLSIFNDPLILSVISMEDNNVLSVPPTFEEVREVVFGIEKNCLVGRDGFSSYFYQCY
ncbi:Uncharacterized protein TCM_010035 [Theobroma cacao]|uniref:Uncharacterized protein n=1 Tax=Theobroma cacao TaxID=3641 RepID=A0A061E5J8_THECC|nr:Uncharacterized protein TCM_010035 [Theobroma cacao]